MADTYKKKEYTESDSVKNLQAEYSSKWQTQMDDLMGKIQNRDPFTYDANADALYQQYKDSYTQLGRQAMQDTMGQAAALTGGYGNSYAQTAGQQMYNKYMMGLSDIIPSLYQLALDKYNAEGDAMYQQYGMMADRENQDYGRYQDERNWAYKQAQDSNMTALEAAELMASVGDYSLLAAYYGLSEEQVKKLTGETEPVASYGGGGGGGSGTDSSSLANSLLAGGTLVNPSLLELATQKVSSQNTSTSGAPKKKPTPVAFDNGLIRR